ncbi:hypothetical protein Ahy_A02g006209 [Arachis hypogaea]|uniref:SWIM-type domain-containing protein n=1 Tax=Arachis hypogaea TaxID=3818 RepID=A0A445E980_ARAHY|nr:hypothetical protein Ahy_A02g006209 [Arachis hypogaea]
MLSHYGTFWRRKDANHRKLVIQRMDEILDMFHHGGTFEKGVDGKIGYYSDNRNCLGDVEVDMLDESRQWQPIWAGDTGYEEFEVHGHPTHHVVNLGKKLCTCQFWMLTGILCVHACAAIARVNKWPEDFYHKLLTMESSENNRPLAPLVKRKPGQLQTKRRKDGDEGGQSRKKSNPATTMKRQLRPFTCFITEHEQKRKTLTRPGKLPLRRRSHTLIGSASLNPMEGLVMQLQHGWPTSSSLCPLQGSNRQERSDYVHSFRLKF